VTRNPDASPPKNFPEVLVVRFSGDASQPSEEWVLTENARCGRSPAAEITLADPRVSRFHAEFQKNDSGWTIRDCSSHGTLLNGIPLKQDQVLPLRQGDRVGIGPFTLLIGPAQTAGSTATVSLQFDHGRSASTVGLSERERDVRAMSGERLRKLFEAGTALGEAQDLEQFAARLLENLIELTGYEWGSVIQFQADESASRSVISDWHRPPSAQISASLLLAAREGTTSLLSEPDLKGSQSIIASATCDAIASTIRVGEDPIWQVYLASSRNTPSRHTDIAIVVDAMIRIAGLVLSDRQREDLAVRQSQMQRDIQFAREVQTRLFGRACESRASGLVGMLSIPGRGVAGDLVGFRDSPSGARYFFLGDVSGKGPAAAMLMAATQAYISSLIDQDQDLVALVPRLNAYLHEVSADSEFVTLWIGCFDPVQGVVRYTDAGHGYAFLLCEEGVITLNEAGGPPVGVVADSAYAVAEISCPAGCCLLLCSDGVIEQQDHRGVELGIEAMRSLLAATPAAQLQDAILKTLSAHAGSTRYSDDVTLAMIEF